MDDVNSGRNLKMLQSEGIQIISVRTTDVNTSKIVRVSNSVKMFPTVCPVCKNKFYSENQLSESDLVLHNHCVQPKEQQEPQLVRTSTPVAELENSPSSSFSDSVTDFFYQSWKNGLHSSDRMPDRGFRNRYHHQVHEPAFKPVPQTPPVVYVNTVIYQAFTPYPYVPQVGYRPDGTFGVLPPFWGYHGQ